MDPGLAGLLEKYVEMRALRRLAEIDDASDPRPRMRRLAARFPGALREIDELPMDVIEARIARLRAGQAPPWAQTLIAYHGWMRVALRVKRAHGRGADAVAVREWLADTHRPSADEPRLERLDVETVAAILRPPGGRLSRWVLTQIARDRGIEPGVAEAQAFGTGNH